MTKKISALLLGLSLISGCALLHPTSTKSASLIVYPSVNGGNLATKAEITPNTLDTINHVRVELFTVNGSNVESPVLNSSSQPIFADVPKADLAKPIQFTRLKAQTHYRIRAFAYNDASTDLAHRISVDDASYTDIVMGTEDRPTITELNLTLKDTTFKGQGSSTVEVGNSEYVENPEVVN